MSDEVKKALAALREPLGNGFMDEVSRLTAARKDSFGSMIEQAQRLTSLDAQFRKMSEQLAERARLPGLTPLLAKADGMRSIAAAPALDARVLERLDRMRRGQELSVTSYIDQARAEVAGSTRMFETIERFRESYAAGSALSTSFARVVDQVTRSSQAMQSIADAREISSLAAMHEASARSISRIAEEAKTFDSLAIKRITDSFERFKTLSLTPVLPTSVSSMFAEAASSAKYLNSLRLPVIDSASTAAIARVWGEQGVDRQLRALGIETGPPGPDIERPTEPAKGLAIRPLFMDAVTLISLLFAFYQWWDSQQTEARIMGAIRDDQVQREKQFEAVKALIAAALEDHAKRAGVRFICRDRISRVRSFPRHGAARLGSVFPNQVVRPLAEEGKWIQIEYYDFIAQETRVGWTLKKYYARIRPPASTD